MEIKLLTPGLYKQYNDFLLCDPNSLFYYTTQYKDFLKELLSCKEEYFLAVENDKIKGVLPLLYIEGKYGRVYNSLPYYGSNGGILAGEEGAFEVLLECYNKIARSNQTAATTLVTNPLLKQKHLTPAHDFIDTRMGQITDLKYIGQANEEIFSLIDSSARRNIRKAIKSGVTAKIDNQQSEFLSGIHKENMKVINGRAKKDKFFEIIDQHLIAGQDYNIYIARKNNKPISALLLFYYNQTVEYFVPATDIKHKNSQPMALILFQAMKDACEKGYKWWNWGGTWLTQEGVRRFKKKWGSRDKPYFYYVAVNNKKILELTKQDILNEYNDFFVIPFNELKHSGEVKYETPVKKDS